LLESARAPRTTVQTPFIWPHGDKWKELFMSEAQPFLDEKETEAFKHIKEEHRKQKK